MIIVNLIRKELQQQRWVIIIGLILCAGIAVITVGTYHYLGQVVEEIPRDLMEYLTQFEVTRELLLIFGDYSLYLWSQWNAKNLFQLVVILSLVMAATQFAGEVSKRTMSFYLTRPVTRRDGYLGKITTGLLVNLLVFGGGTIMLWVASLVMGYQADWGRMFIALLISLAWATAFYLLACIISTFYREPVMAGVMAGITGLLLSLPGIFAVSRHFSIFYNMRAADYFLGGESPLLTLGGGLLLSSILLFIGLAVFKKRDF